MDVFEKAVEGVKSIGTTIYNSSKEQGELAGMKVQKSVLEKKLQESYAEIGKKYLDYVKNSDGSETFDISDIMEVMQPNLDKLAEINKVLDEKEIASKEAAVAKSKQKVKDAFEAQKAKLDKALEMDIISQEEYDEKLAIAKKKVDNYDQIKKIDMQLEMGIITSEEHAEKVDKLLK